MGVPLPNLAGRVQRVSPCNLTDFCPIFVGGSRYAGHKTARSDPVYEIFPHMDDRSIHQSFMPGDDKVVTKIPINPLG